MSKKYAILVSIVLMTVATALMTMLILWILQRFSLEGVIVVGLCCVALFWGWVIRWLHTTGKLTMSHILVIWMVATGTVMGGASYYLAYRGITATLETLSRYVMVETVAGTAGYFIKSGFENVKKNNNNRDL